MSDTVQITLGANVSGALQGLANFQRSVGAATSALSVFSGPSGLGSVVSSMAALESKVSLLAAAFRVNLAGSIAGLVGGAGLGLMVKEAVALTNALDEVRKSAANLFDSQIAGGQKFGETLDRSTLAGLLTIKESADFGQRMEAVLGSGLSSEAQAPKIAALTRELRQLLEVRQRLADFDAQRKKAIAAQGRAGLIGLEADLETFNAYRSKMTSRDSAWVGLGLLDPEKHLENQRRFITEARDKQLAVLEAKETEHRDKMAGMDAAARIVAEAELKAFAKRRVVIESEYQKEINAVEDDALAKRREKKAIEAAREKASALEFAREEADRRQAEADLAAQRAEELALAYEVERNRIEGDFKLTESEKRAQLLASFREQLAQNPDNPRAQKQLGFLEQTADPNSGLQQTVSGFVRLRDEIGTTAQAMANLAVSPFRGAVDGMASSINGLIMGTMTWRDALVNLGQTIVSTVVQAFSQMIAKMLAMKALGFLGTLIGGPVGAAMGAAIPGKASGGVVGNGLYQVGEMGPEYVVNAGTLSRLGTGFFDALQAGYAPSISGPSYGAAGGGRPNKTTVAVFDDRRQMRDFLESAEGERLVVDILGRTSHEWRG